MNRHFTAFTGITALLLLSATANAQEEIDEDALFGDTASVIDAAGFTDSGKVADETKEKSVSISGRVSGSAAGIMSRKFFDEARLSNTSFQGAIVGNVNGDIRLPLSIKSYINTEIAYTAPDDSVNFYLPELFLDWNFGYKAFFRLGKQLLQWGRGFFFNPVDLVNVEKTRFFNELTGREGAFGLKMHIPFQTRANIYSFINMGSVSRIDSIAVALKAEFLVRATEFAFSVWGKNNFDPVYGFDFSTRIGDFSVTGEVALYQSIDTLSLSWDGMTPVITKERVDWAPRVSLGIGRFFDLGNFSDRLLLNMEAYYNHAGKSARDLSSYIPEWFDEGIKGAAADLYQQIPPGALTLNNLSKWYAAAFLTISRFIITDMTLSSSVLYNFNQRCAMLTGGINYTNIHNLSFDLIINGFPGRNYTEYTLFDQGMSVELRSGILF